MAKKYTALPDTWYDEGTEAKVIAGPYDSYIPDGIDKDNCPPDMNINGWALFEGIRNGKLDEETCCLDEFEITEEENA